MSLFDFLGFNSPTQSSSLYDNGDQSMRDFHLMQDGTPEPVVPETPSIWSQLSNAQRFGVIGNTLQKIGSQLGGEPQPSLHMDRLSVPDLSTSHGPVGQVAPVSLTPLQVNLPNKPGALALRALGQLRDYI